MRRLERLNIHRSAADLWVLEESGEAAAAALTNPRASGPGGQTQVAVVLVSVGRRRDFNHSLSCRRTSCRMNRGTTCGT